MVFTVFCRILHKILTYALRRTIVAWKNSSLDDYFVLEPCPFAILHFTCTEGGGVVDQKVTFQDELGMGDYAKKWFCMTGSLGGQQKVLFLYKAASLFLYNFKSCCEPKSQSLICLLTDLRGDWLTHDVFVMLWEFPRWHIVSKYFFYILFLSFTVKLQVVAI